jgi:hypothetical protein
MSWTGWQSARDARRGPRAGQPEAAVGWGAVDGGRVTGRLTAPKPQDVVDSRVDQVLVNDRAIHGDSFIG